MNSNSNKHPTLTLPDHPTKHITERAEEALRESEERYRGLTELSPQGIFLHLDGKIVFANAAGARLLGAVNPKQLVGRRVLDFVHPDYQKVVTERIRQLTAEERQVPFIQEKLIRLDGTVFDAEVAAIPFSYQGQPAVQVIFSDITERKRVEETLRQLAENMAAAQRIAHFGSWEVRWTPDLKSVGPHLWSDECYHIFGFEPGSVEPTWEFFGNLIHPDDRELGAQLFFKAIREQTDYSYEYRSIRPDGSIRHIHEQAKVVLDEQTGQPVKMIGTIHDITEHKQAELEHQALLEIMQGPIVAKDLKEFLGLVHRAVGRVIYAENFFVTLYNKGAGLFEEVYSVDKYDPPAPPAKLEKSISAYVFHTGKPLLLTQAEFEVLTAQGEMELVGADSPSWLGVPLKTSSEIIGVMVVQNYDEPNCYSEHDKEFLASIAGQVALAVERKRAEEILHLTRFSFDQVADAVHWIEKEGWFVDVNETACHMLGYTREEFLQRSIFDIDPELSEDQWHKGWQHLKQMGMWTNERTHRTKEGRIIPVEVRANHIEFGGRAIICTFVRDITERKQAEEARAKLEEQLRQAHKMESVGRLAGGIAHDFNNLLTVIRGYCGLMQSELSAESPLQKDLEQIQRAGERAAALTRQLLAFSRKQILTPTRLDLNDLITNLHKMLRRLISEDITLALVLEPGLWPVTADPSQIEQVIMNLVVNARDAMPSGGRLTLQTSNVQLDDRFADIHPDTPTGPCVMLSVTDTGHGMDEAILAHIFEPFFTTKEVGQGTGLGLAMVYGIIKQSGGEITVSSKPGQSTTFKIYLPAHEAVQDLVVSETQAAGRGGTETILLVEDEEEVRSLVERILKDGGYTVLQAGDGNEALSLVGQHRETIDLLLTDVVMPQMSGRELAERLKVRHPQIKVLFMSGYTDDAVVRHGLSTAGVEFLSKPFSPDALDAKVRQVLDR